MGVCHPLTIRGEHVPVNIVAIWFDPFIDKSSHVRQKDLHFPPFLDVKVEHRRPVGSARADTKVQFSALPHRGRETNGDNEPQGEQDPS